MSNTLYIKQNQSGCVVFNNVPTWCDYATSDPDMQGCPECSGPTPEANWDSNGVDRTVFDSDYTCTGGNALYPAMVNTNCIPETTGLDAAVGTTAHYVTFDAASLSAFNCVPTTIPSGADHYGQIYSATAGLFLVSSCNLLNFCSGFTLTYRVLYLPAPRAFPTGPVSDLHALELWSGFINSSPLATGNSIRLSYNAGGTASVDPVVTSDILVSDPCTGDMVSVGTLDFTDLCGTSPDYYADSWITISVDWHDNVFSGTISSSRTGDSLSFSVPYCFTPPCFCVFPEGSSTPTAGPGVFRIVGNDDTGMYFDNITLSP